MTLSPIKWFFARMAGEYREYELRQAFRDQATLRKLLTQEQDNRRADLVTYETRVRKLRDYTEKLESGHFFDVMEFKSLKSHQL